MRSSINITSLKKEIKEEIASSGGSEWKLQGSSNSNTTSITLPTNYNELLIVAKDSSGSGYYGSVIITKNEISDSYECVSLTLRGTDKTYEIRNNNYIKLSEADGSITSYLYYR